MINTRVRYIAYTHTTGGVRHHHFTSANYIIAEANGTATQGDVLYVPGFSTLEFNGVWLPFAFMSVHGDVNGNQLYLTSGSQAIHVGTNDIDVMLIYCTIPGGPDGGPGVWVDAFNVDVGDFSDSLQFIQVLTPPTPPDSVDAAKTSLANQDGDVSTAAAENIRAAQYVDGVPFQTWKKVFPTASQVATELVSLAKNQSGEIWFAFYKTPPNGGGTPNFNPHTYEAMEYGIWVWGGDDTCGNGGHWIHPKGPGPSPWKMRVSKRAMQKLTPAQQRKLNSIIEQYPRAANIAYGAMTRVIGMLKTVNEILSGTKAK
jgi:hypothetical protein